MQAHRISIESIDEGIDRKHLYDLRRRFGQIHNERLLRTRSALPHRQRIFLDLLPLLFHTNHPMLPGYVSHSTPAGVSGYNPTVEELRLAQNLARSFRHNSDPHQPRRIYALFLMGSVGTVAHNESSDVDVWVCHQPGLSRAEIADLERKCRQLRQWAMQLGLEAHFFPMDCEHFQRGGGASFDSEGSGSAQHYLLLDEFYRTGLLLAGRAPLWWFTPTGRETDYQEYTRTLLGKRFIPAAEVLDFGGVAHIPGGEFVGAGVWQLYKGIESPYKSVLKLMLLECYASEYPTITPLALSFKEAIYNGQLDVNELDPYVMVYRRLERYLLQRREPRRLELLRRCLYFKIDKPLTRAPARQRKSWQRNLLEKLVSEWGWDRAQLVQLDARPRWKAQQTLSEHRLLVNELTNSYRFLMDFARQTHASAAIRADELNVLGRKLHAAFERRAGKIDWINPHISPDLSESFITLARENHPANGHPVFSVYAQAASDMPYQHRYRLKQSRDIVEPLVWCHCNGVLTQQTRCEPAPGEFPLSTFALRQTIQAIRRWLPLPLPPVTHDSFQRRATTRAVLMLINVGTDPQHHLQQRGIYRITDHIDPLSFSRVKESLIASIALVSINTWNEVSTYYFSRNALIACLQHYLRLCPPNPGHPQTPSQRPRPELTIHCLSASRATAISQRVEELFGDISAGFRNSGAPSRSRYLFEVSGHYHCLQFNQNLPCITRPLTLEALLEHLGQPQSHYSPLIVDRGTLQGHPLRAIAAVASDSSIRVFYLPLAENEADVYVVDEKGSLLKMRTAFLDYQTLLRPLHRFIRSAIERQRMEASDQALGIYPVDFYELKSGPGGITHGERRRVNTELNRLFFFNIQVIADGGENACGQKSAGIQESYYNDIEEGDQREPDHMEASTYDREPNYRIYCDQREFTAMEFGEGLFDAVARYILSHRQTAERYPCYITDLDLSQCRLQLAPQGRLQIIHYLRIKTRLEQRLNAALRAL